MFKKIIKEFTQVHCSHHWEHIETVKITRNINTYEQETVVTVCCSKCELVDHISPHKWSRIQDVQSVPRYRSARHDKARLEAQQLEASV